MAELYLCTMTTQALDEFMNDNEVCEFLRISHPTLRKLINDPASKLSGVKRVMIGKRRRWVKDSLMRVMECLQ
jgi:predicted DNA-binding transcriptional regulator AlpA